MVVLAHEDALGILIVVDFSATQHDVVPGRVYEEDVLRSSFSQRTQELGERGSSSHRQHVHLVAEVTERFTHFGVVDSFDRTSALPDVFQYGDAIVDRSPGDQGQRCWATERTAPYWTQHLHDHLRPCMYDSSLRDSSLLEFIKRMSMPYNSL